MWQYLQICVCDTLIIVHFDSFVKDTLPYACDMLKIVRVDQKEVNGRIDYENTPHRIVEVDPPSLKHLHKHTYAKKNKIKYIIKTQNTHKNSYT